MNLMRHFILICFAAVLALPVSVLGQYSTHSFSHGGQSRKYLKYIPAAYDGTTPVPVVLALHGMGDNMNNFSGIGMNYIADTANFIVITPEALVDNLAGATAWNSGAGAFGIQLNQNVDDIGFLSRILDTLETLHNIDTTRIFACGFSMGGFMCHRLACEMSDRIAAIASVAGTKGTYVNCANAGQVPVCHFHGTADATVAYSGNNFGDDAEQTVQWWSNHNGCNNPADTVNLPDIASDGFTVDHFRWRGCDDAKTVELFKVYGADHQWLGTFNDIAYTPEIWKFFSRYSSSGGVAVDPQQADIPVKVFPNPATSRVNIQWETTGPGDAEIALYDLAGARIEQIRTRTVSGMNEVSLDLSTRKSGLYFIHIHADGQTVSQKLSVQH